jgi:hypothetical protein
MPLGSLPVEVEVSPQQQAPCDESIALEFHHGLDEICSSDLPFAFLIALPTVDVYL